MISNKNESLEFFDRGRGVKIEEGRRVNEACGVEIDEEDRGVEIGDGCGVEIEEGCGVEEGRGVEITEGRGV